VGQSHLAIAINNGDDRQQVNPAASSGTALVQLRRRSKAATSIAAVIRSWIALRLLVIRTHQLRAPATSLETSCFFELNLPPLRTPLVAGDLQPAVPRVGHDFSKGRP